jgi:hypothetical protein
MIRIFQLIRLLSTCRNLGFLLIGLRVIPVIGQSRITQLVISNGAYHSSSGSIQMQATVGQPVVGLVGSGLPVIELGFWHSLPERTSFQRQRTDIPIAKKPSQATLLEIWPNPARESTQLRFLNQAKGIVHIAILDTKGIPMFSRKFQPLEDPTIELRIDVSMWPPGIYQAILYTHHQSYSKTLVILK